MTFDLSILSGNNFPLQIWLEIQSKDKYLKYDSVNFYEGKLLHKRYVVQCVPEKTEPWNNGMLRASCGVYDYYHIYFMNYD